MVTDAEYHIEGERDMSEECNLDNSVLSMPRDVLAETECCEKNFSCLCRYTRTVCEVRDAYGFDFVCVRKEDAFHCCYRSELTREVCICECPTRVELFKRYAL